MATQRGERPRESRPGDAWTLVSRPQDAGDGHRARHLLPGSGAAWGWASEALGSWPRPHVLLELRAQGAPHQGRPPWSAPLKQAHYGRVTGPLTSVLGATGVLLGGRGSEVEQDRKEPVLPHQGGQGWPRQN